MSLAVSLILPLFGALCGLIIKIIFLLSCPFKKNRPSVGSSAAEVDYYALQYVLAYAMSGQEIFRP